MTYFMKAQSASETHLAAMDNKTATETLHSPFSAAFNSKINDCVILFFVRFRNRQRLSLLQELLREVCIRWRLISARLNQ